MNPNEPLESSIENSRRLLEALPGMPVASRIDALEELIRTSSPEIRQHTLHVGSALLSDDLLVRYLRNDQDAILRNAGLEILKMRGGRGFRVALELLEDPDPDVVLQAVLVLDHLKNPRALEGLQGALHHPDTNVVQAAIVAIGHLGDDRAVEDLIPFLEADSWLQMAAIEALGDLRCAAAVAPLTSLLTDLMLGPMAAEALARIGGEDACRSLANHWVQFHEQLDAESMLGLVAHVLEGMGRRQPVADELFASVLPFKDGEGEEALAAARILLALGPSEHDSRALEILQGQNTPHLALPPCLRARTDLIGDLLTAGSERQRAWGLCLAARSPDSTPVVGMVWALNRLTDPALLPAAIQCLQAVASRQLDEPLLELYLRLPREARQQLRDALAHRRDRLRVLVEERKDLAGSDRLELLALVGEPAGSLVVSLLELAPEERTRVLAQIFDRPDVLRQVPWMDLLAEDPDAYSDLAAAAADVAELRHLLPRLRALLREQPKAALIRALGSLRDRESIPILKSLVEERPELAAPALQALGRIGGNDARGELRRVIEDGDDDLQRVAYRALAQCATEEEEALFLDSVDHQDWNVRLAVVEVLGGSARDAHVTALARLAADPVALVAKRALSFLEPGGASP